MDIGGTTETPDMNFLLTLAGLRDIVGGLHRYQRVHLHAERLSMRSAISPDKAVLPLSKLERAGWETCRAAAAVTNSGAANTVDQNRTGSLAKGRRLVYKASLRGNTTILRKAAYS
jgi:hypothetical protein